MEIFTIAITAILINNIVLSKFLGICPFLGVSKKIQLKPWGWTFQSSFSGNILHGTFGIYHLILTPLEIVYDLITFI